MLSGGIVAVLVVGALVAGWKFYGRYAVEGGKVVWAARYQEHEALADAIEAGAAQKALDEALGIAVSDGDEKAARMLADAGASINPEEKGFCKLAGLIRFGKVEEAAIAVELGADPTLCDTSPNQMMWDLLQYGYDNAPQVELNRVLVALVEAGGDPSARAEGKDASALELAEKYELDRVVAFLKAPEANRPTGGGGPDVERPHGKAGTVAIDDLKPVCDGEPQPNAAPYEKSDEYAASVFYFERRHDAWRYPGRRHGVTLPKWWTTWEEPADAQLVVCVDLSDKEKVDTCHYEGEGGGVYVYNAHVEVELREAKTGEVVDTMAFDKKAPQGCPPVKFGKEQEGIYPSYETELKDFLAPHVGGPS